MQPFHLAITVRDLAEAKIFYCNLLGCSQGRCASEWVDFNLYGHQLVCHLDPGLGRGGQVPRHNNPVDAHAVPVPHFGVILSMADWKVLADQLEKSGIEFIISPGIRFAGQVGEQATMFFQDPSGNSLEFKAFSDPSQIFAS